MLYEYLNKIFSDDHQFAGTFKCFDLWHIGYLVILAAIVTLSIIYLKNKPQEKREKYINIFVGIAFGLYMADFFLMPFAYGEIDVDKLPFHSCTTMSIVCFLSSRNTFLKKYRIHFALLGLISNLCYISYPSGVVDVPHVSYHAWQTLLFHGAMVVYGLLTIIFCGKDFKLKRSYVDLMILAGLTVWAFIGNTLYSGSAAGYSRDFNWFFIKQDPFGAIPESIAPLLAPFVNLVAFFGMEIIVYLIFTMINKKQRKKQTEAKEAEEKIPANV